MEKVLNIFQFLTYLYYKHVEDEKVTEQIEFSKYSHKYPHKIYNDILILDCSTAVQYVNFGVKIKLN